MKKEMTQKGQSKNHIGVDSEKIELSIIVPAYNLEDSLAECLTSILQQNVKMQIIVVDDKSTDGTRDIIQTFAEKYSEITPIYQEENKRQSAARNSALNVAIGEYIHFCDGDDLVPCGAYHELLRVAQEENADIVVGNYARKYPNEGNIIRPFSHYQATTAIERCFEAGNLTLWNKIYRRSKIEENHLRFDEDIHLSEDLLFYMRFLQTEPKAAYTDESIYIYTDPFFHADCDNNESTIRYASAKFTRNLADVWKRVFSAEIKSNHELWYLAYWWNLKWYYDFSWKMIVKPAERRESFTEMRSLIIWVQNHVGACDWNINNHMQKFVEIFGVDYHSFCGISYEEYVFLSSLRTRIVPKRPSESISQKLSRLSTIERDSLLASEIDKLLEELKIAFQNGLVKRSFWRKSYWDVLDSIINDYWRQINNMEKKIVIWKKIFDVFSDVNGNIAECFFYNPEDVWRFQCIFGADYPTLYELSEVQYLLFDGINRWCNAGVSSGGGIVMGADPVQAFLNACRNGQIGMRKILKAIKEWAYYKLRKLSKR